MTELMGPVSWCVESSSSPQFWLNTIYARLWPASSSEKVEGESSDSLQRHSFLTEDQMDFLNPLGEAVEGLSRNSVTFIILNKASR